MSKIDNVKGYEDKKTINWYITPYDKLLANAYN